MVHLGHFRESVRQVYSYKFQEQEAERPTSDSYLQSRDGSPQVCNWERKLIGQSTVSSGCDDEGAVCRCVCEQVCKQVQSPACTVQYRSPWNAFKSVFFVMTACVLELLCSLWIHCRHINSSVCFVIWGMCLLPVVCAKGPLGGFMAALEDLK